ncbi:hypothetical protein ACFL03_13545 [Thermodesulfobacteriota bacterium]
MKRILITFLFVVFCCCQFAYAGNTSTGDSELDRSLETLNKGAKENTSEFAKKLGRKFGVSESTTERLLNRVGMSPSDVYMTAKVSKISKRSIEDVENAYKENKGKGWGVIAKKMGIKPGSKEFHELKRDDSGMLNDYKGKGKKKKDKGKEDKAKGKKGNAKGKKGKGKKGGPAEDDQEAAENDKSKKKGFFERWFGGSKKE